MIVRLIHQAALIRSQISTIPESRRWKIGDLQEDTVLPFQLFDAVSNKWYKFHFGLDHYNTAPPNLTVRHPTTNAPTTDLQFWPPTLAAPSVLFENTPTTNGQRRVLGRVKGAARHPEHNGPFVCLPGLKDFHSHPKHIDQPWAAYRNTLTLDKILSDLADMLDAKFPQVKELAPPPL